MIAVHLAFFLSADPATAKDLYRNFAELKAAHIEGTDYEVTVVDHGVDISILAPHGGAIEWGTEELAREVLQAGFNLYLFKSHLCRGPKSPGIREGLCRTDRFGSLHLTSHHFDDPRAVQLAEKSRFCVSLHGYGSPGDSLGVMIGGLSADFRARMANAFRKHLPEVRLVPPKQGLSGRHPMNIVNRCKENGVQLEFSPELRKKLRQEPAFRTRIATVIADTLKQGCAEAAEASEPGESVLCSKSRE